jgi:acyl carrier protein
MTIADTIEGCITEAMADIAPDADLAGVDPDAPLADAVDLDSMDSLRFLERLGDLAGITIPDRDAARLRSLADVRRYLAGRLGAG